MAFVKFVLGTIGSIVAFVITVKLLKVLLALVGVVLSLLWFAIVVGFFLLIAWVIYKIIKPRDPAQV